MARNFKKDIEVAKEHNVYENIGKMLGAFATNDIIYSDILPNTDKMGYAEFNQFCIDNNLTPEMTLEDALKKLG